MTGMTDFITTARWVDVWTIWFVLVDDAYQALEQHYGRWRRSGPPPIFHDSEVITVALIIDTWFHGHEALGLAFLRQQAPTLFPHLPPDGWFNQRRTRLGPLIEQIRQQVTRQYGLITADERDRLIDSAPIPVATYQRASANRTVTGSEYFGVMNNRRAKLFGFRLHLTTTTRGVVDTWLLAPAAIHDSQVMPAVLDTATQQVVLGDGAYHNPAAAPVLAARQVVVHAPPRRDSRKRAPWPDDLRRWVGKVRRRIETALSVLTTVFNVECPHARSLRGLVCRISTRLLAYHLSFVTGMLLAQLATS